MEFFSSFFGGYDFILSVFDFRGIAKGKFCKRKWIGSESIDFLVMSSWGSEYLDAFCIVFFEQLSSQNQLGHVRLSDLCTYFQIT